MWSPRPKQLSILKVLLFLLCLWPLLRLGWLFLADDLGANPIEAVVRSLGDWALRFLLLTLTITPLRRLLTAPWLIRLRRMLGLYTFFYALLHLLAYIVLDQYFDWPEIGKDIAKRPFITLGMATFLLLLPLAATSSNAMIRRLGGQRWQHLHSLIYGIALMAVVHYWWMVKADISTPAIYALVLICLLGIRFWWYRRDRLRKLASLLPQPKGKVIPIHRRP